MTLQNYLKRWIAWSVVGLAPLLIGCDKPVLVSTPVYSNLQVGGFDYTHRVITNINIEDEDGETFSTGRPGGEGSLSCCVSIKGRKIKVTWFYSHFKQEYYKNNKPEVYREEYIEMPEAGNEKKYLYIHIFPDERVELELTENIMPPNRFENIEAYNLIIQDQRIKRLDEYISSLGDFYSFGRISDKIAGEAYKKYKFTDKNDLAAYITLNLTVSPTFDTHPLVKPLLDESLGKRGHFAERVKKLAPSDLKAVRARDPATKPKPMEETDEL